MSYFWDNVIWQSKDGSWNRGYLKRISGENNSHFEDEDYGYCSEWDDDFDSTEFDCVSTGLRTFDAALDYAPHGNPGTHTEIAYNGNSRSCKELDLMAFHHSNPEAKAKHLRSVHNRKRREHFAKLEAEWSDNDLRALNLAIELKNDDAVYDRLGVWNSVNGLAVVDGDWLKVEGKRIKNLKTGKFHNRVGSVRSISPRRRY